MEWMLLVVIAAAYGTTWFFVIKSTKIIDRISKSEYKSSRDIVKNVKL